MRSPLPILLGLGLLSCGGALGAAKDEAGKADDTSCAAGDPKAEVDLMGWDPAARAKLTTLQDQGIVVVHYESKGCDAELEVLPDCIATGDYDYHPQAEKQSKVIRNKHELHASLPLGAAKLSGKLEGSKVVRTDALLVGTSSIAARASIGRGDLTGSGCARATHVVRTFYLGGFAMASGEAREMEASASVFLVGEAGGSMSSSSERLDRGGVAEACEAAQKSGMRSTQCEVPLRLALSPISGEAARSGNALDPLRLPSNDDDPFSYGSWSSKAGTAGSAQEITKLTEEARRQRAQIFKAPAPKFTGDKAALKKFLAGTYLPWAKKEHELAAKAGAAYLEAYQKTTSPAERMDLAGEASLMWQMFTDRQWKATPTFPRGPNDSPSALDTSNEVNLFFQGALAEALPSTFNLDAQPLRRCLWIAAKSSMALSAKCAEARKRYQ